MSMAFVLFGKLASLFVFILLGFVLVRSGLLKAEDSRPFSILSLYIICPLAIVNAFEVSPTPEILKGMMLSVGFAILTHVIFIIAARLLRKPLKLVEVEEATLSYPNAGMLAIPLVSSILGPEWVIYTCGYNVIQIFLLWTHCRILLSGQTEVDWKKILLNTNIIAMFIGIFVFFTGFRFPSAIDSAIDSLAAMIGPVGMLVTGIVIGGMSLKKVVAFRRAWFVSALRLLLFPAVITLIAKYSGIANLAPNGDTILMISLLSLAGPSAATVMQMALIYCGRDAGEEASAINIISMLCCAITMPLIIALYTF